MQMDFQFGGGHARAALAQYFANDVCPLLDGRFADHVGRQLFSAASQVAELLGWTAYDKLIFDTPSLTIKQQKLIFGVPQVTMRTREIVFGTPSVVMKTIKTGQYPEFYCDTSTVIPKCTVKWSDIYIDVPETFLQQQHIKLDLPEFTFGDVQIIMGIPEFFHATATMGY